MSIFNITANTLDDGYDVYFENVTCFDSQLSVPEMIPSLPCFLTHEATYNDFFLLPINTALCLSCSSVESEVTSDKEKIHYRHLTLSLTISTFV